MKRLLLATTLFLSACGLDLAYAQVPFFPQTLPANTVVGRLSAGAGPTEAITFSQLAAQLATSNNLFPSGVILGSSAASSVPAGLASGTTFAIRLGDNSADATMTAAAGTFSGTVVAPSFFPNAGTTTIAPIKFTTGTNLTAATAGVLEYDGVVFYQTPNASNRAIPVDTHFQRLTANFTLDATTTNAQKALNGTTNGAITLPGTTGYRFRLTYMITNTGTTSHTWSVIFGGAATLTSGTMSCVALTNTASTVAATSQGYTTTLGTAYVVTAASTSATENVTINCDGIVNINAGGTFIPQVKLSAATTGTATMLAGSYFELWPQGLNTVVSVGNWS